MSEQYWSEIMGRLESIENRIRFQETLETPSSWVFLTTPLTSTSFDGDSFSTTAKTSIDLSAVFGTPAGIKAIDVGLRVRDSGSLANNNLYFGLSPNDTNGQVIVRCTPSGLPNDFRASDSGVCPCDANGDVYYQVEASGSGTFDVWLEVWGYKL